MRKIGLALAFLASLFVCHPQEAAAQATSMIVDWEAPGDDGDVGTAHHYEMRYSSAAIVGTDTTSWWNAATVVSGLPIPLAPTTTQSMTVNATFSAGVTYIFIMKACDEAGNCSAYSNVADTTVATDAQPVVNNPGNKTVAELANLAFTASATDADAGTVITWSFDPGAPSGASINSASGAFSWTPTEAQGPGAYPVTIRATDNWSPPSSGIAVFNVTVTEVNIAPAVTSPGDKTVNELIALGFTFSATDADLPANTVIRSLDPGFPVGAGVNPSTGVFTWTPTESQGPGVHLIVFRATDNGVPSLNSSVSINVTVNEVNVAPVVTNPGNQTVAETTTLSFIAQVTDTDLPANAIVWSMDGGGPPGSTFNSSSGQFIWTPTEAQGPGTYPVTIRATDNGTPVLSGTASFTINVGAVNQAPVVTNPGNKTVDEFATLLFTMAASDADEPIQTMTWTLDAGAPAGASVNPGSLGSATFSLTPLEADGPGDYTVTVRVTDNGSPVLDGTATFNVHVNEANSPPNFTSGGQPASAAISVTVGAPYNFTFIGTDSDVPANVLKYFMITPITGASIDSITGAFTFTPTIAGTFTTQIRVRDNGAPPLSRSGKLLVFTATGGAAPDTMNPAAVTSFVNVSGLSYSAVVPTKNEDGPCPGGTNGTTLTDLLELRVYAHFTGTPAESSLLLGAFPASAGATVPIDVFLAAGSTGTIWPVAVDSVGNVSCIGTTLSFTVAVPPGGLLGQYFDNIDFTGAEVDRFDQKVFFSFGEALPFPSMGKDTFSIRWTGYVTPEHSETYAFYVTSDDGMVLWVDTGSGYVQIAGVWADHEVKEYKGFVDLLAGHQYPIKIDYYENTQKALAKFFWSSHHTNKVAVPASALSH